MATINFDGTKNKIKAFDPFVDVLTISGMSAAGSSVKDTADGVKITDLVTGNWIILTDTTMNQLSTL